MDTVIRVVIIEDDPTTRARLQEKIDSLDGFEVPATADTVASATEILATQEPDLLLVDLDLPDGSGLSVIEQQNDLRPDLPIMVISVFGDERTVIQAIESGAQGYLLKADSSVAIEQSLRQLLAGGAPISAPIARHLIRRLQPQQKSPPAEQSPAKKVPSVLSPRELEVLNLAAKGYSYLDIAELMSVTPSTVSSYTKRIYQKLSVHSKSEAIFEAMRMGLVEQPRPD